MGNCQAAEVATVVIQHREGKVERMHRSVSARDVMDANPGHYVAVVVAALPLAANGETKGAEAAPVRHLKLLRPDDTLHIGHVYRLISFEEVLKEFAAKKHVRLSKLLLGQQRNKEEEEEEKKQEKKKKKKYREGSLAVMERQMQDRQREQLSGQRVEDGVHANMRGRSRIIGGGAARAAAMRHVQWRPSLQSISETGN